MVWSSWFQNTGPENISEIASIMTRPCKKRTYISREHSHYHLWSIPSGGFDLKIISLIYCQFQSQNYRQNLHQNITTRIISWWLRHFTATKFGLFFRKWEILFIKRSWLCVKFKISPDTAFPLAFVSEN